MTRGGGGACVGVVVAMPAEARSFTGRAAAVGALVRLEGENVLLRVGGVGPARARAAALSLLDGGARSLVSFGTAGGLLSSLAPGALLIPARVLSERGASFATDAAWAARIRDVIGIEGDVVESARVLASAAEKEALFRATSAHAVDMESAAVAAAALSAGAPFVAVRAICDPASMVIPEAALRSFDPDGRLRPMRLAGALLRSPGEFGALFRLASAAAAAHAALRASVRTLGRRLAAPA